MILLKNVRAGRFKLPNGVKIAKGETISVPHSVIANRHVSKLLATGKFAIVNAAVVLPEPSEIPTDPPAPVPPPAPATVEESTEEPIIKKKARRKKKPTDTD